MTIAELRPALLGPDTLATRRTLIEARADLKAADFPLVRQSMACPLCQNGKRASLIACWPCFNANYGHGASDAVQMAADKKLASAEFEHNKELWNERVRDGQSAEGMKRREEFNAWFSDARAGIKSGEPCVGIFNPKGEQS